MVITGERISQSISQGISKVMTSPVFSVLTLVILGVFNPVSSTPLFISDVTKEYNPEGKAADKFQQQQREVVCPANLHATPHLINHDHHMDKIWQHSRSLSEMLFPTSSSASVFNIMIKRGDNEFSIDLSGNYLYVNLLCVNAIGIPNIDVTSEDYNGHTITQNLVLYFTNTHFYCGCVTFDWHMVKNLHFNSHLAGLSGFFKDIWGQGCKVDKLPGVDGSVTTPKPTTPKLTTAKPTTPKPTTPKPTTPKPTTPKPTTPKPTTPKPTTPKPTTPKPTTPKPTTPKPTTPQPTTPELILPPVLPNNQRYQENYICDEGEVYAVNYDHHKRKTYYFKSNGDRRTKKHHLYKSNARTNSKYSLQSNELFIDLSGKTMAVGWLCLRTDSVSSVTVLATGPDGDKEIVIHPDENTGDGSYKESCGNLEWHNTVTLKLTFVNTASPYYAKYLWAQGCSLSN